MSDGFTRFSHRLLDENEDGAAASLNAYIFSDDVHLQMPVQFDDPADEADVGRVVESVAARSRNKDAQ
jgi:hypothetical protein